MAIFRFTNSFEDDGHNSKREAETLSIIDENMQMAMARKESGFDIASEALRLVVSGEVDDPELERLCLAVFPELAFTNEVDAIIKKSKLVK
ncbi:MAG: hypothetical protein ACTS9Y_00305 [Methylophilus sp.]|uniref:hypothetical protein n=1 Tax=Methylophilus sp. TaxID=29541 RepID=UPI003FA00AF7